jgi:DNA-directed RNA polymerase specialized sigma24 family protein
LKFRSKSESELKQLNDDDLVAYMVKARDTGHDDQVAISVCMLLDKRQKKEIAELAIKVGNFHDAEDIWHQIMENALKAKFRGVYTGEFFSLVKKIRRARIADFFEKKRKSPDLIAPNDDGSNPLDGYSGNDEFEGGVDLSMIVEDLLAGLSERDRMIAELRMKNIPAKEVAETVSRSGLDGSEGLTSINCDTIYSRFKKSLRATLADAEGTAT